MIPYSHPQRRNTIDRQSLIVKDIVSQRSGGGSILGGKVVDHFLGKGVRQCDRWRQERPLKVS